MKWLLTILSVVGVVLNIRQDRRCFYIWAVTNSSWMVIDWRKGIYEQAALFAVYLGLSVWGYWSWKRKS